MILCEIRTVRNTEFKIINKKKGNHLGYLLLLSAFCRLTIFYKANTTPKFKEDEAFFLILGGVFLETRSKLDSDFSS